MASATPHTILLYRNGARDGYVQEEQASVAITPGDLIEWDGSGALRPHTAGGNHSQRMIALENPYDDDNTVAAIDSDYQATDTVRYIYGVAGDKVYMNFAGGTAVVQGGALESNGDGSVTPVTVAAATLEGAVVGFAEAAVAAGGTRVIVRIA